MEFRNVGDLLAATKDEVSQLRDYCCEAGLPSSGMGLIKVICEGICGKNSRANNLAARASSLASRVFLYFCGQNFVGHEALTGHMWKLEGMPAS